MNGPTTAGMHRPTATKPTEVMIGEASRLLGISAQHVRYLEQTGQLRARRIGLYRIFDRHEVEELARDRYRKATGQPYFRGDPHWWAHGTV